MDPKLNSYEVKVTVRDQSPEKDTIYHALFESPNLEIGETEGMTNELTEFFLGWAKKPKKSKKKGDPTLFDYGIEVTVRNQTTERDVIFHAPVISRDLHLDETDDMTRELVDYLLKWTKLPKSSNKKKKV